MNKHCIKICPSCGKEDTTNFSTCGFCTVRYDAKISRKKVDIDGRALVIILPVICVVGVLSWYAQSWKIFKTDRMTHLKESIKAANRPRLIELYYVYRGIQGDRKLFTACDEMIKNCQKEYFGKIDFERINVEDRANRDLILALSSRSPSSITTITGPTVYLFNRRGDGIVQLKGIDLTDSELHRYLEDLDTSQ